MADARTLRAAPLPSDIHVDGVLDEAAWAAAQPATDFVQYDPDEGARPAHPTEVRVLIGSDALYIGARMFDDPANVRPRLNRRDESVDGDVFAVSIDSRHDHLTAFYFRISAGGALRDAVNSGNGLDLSWDAVWEGKAHVDSLGWTAEMRIPLSQLPYSRAAGAEWGIQFERFTWNTQEQDFYAFTPKNEQGGVRRFAHLAGLGALPAPARVEAVPYVSSRAEYLQVPAADPFRSGHDYVASVGGDLRIRLTSTQTLNATVNPDFGQVEVDPAVVNLTAFETFFPEKRPFFVQGAELFDFGSLRTFNSSGVPTLFFSRRIGRQPQRVLGGPGYAYVDAPEQTTIATAAKLTGKTASGWSTAFLDAVTTREEARYLDEDGARQAALVEPLTNYAVGRVRRETNGGNTQFGALLTGVNRDLSDPALESLLRRSAYVGGVDVNHAWHNQRWVFDASLAASRVAGSEGAIAATQRSSARYYQRPDATSFAFDPSRTSLTGYVGQASVAKNSGTHWLGSLTYQDVSPGFESNDLGFQGSADRRSASSLVMYQENQPGRLFRNYQVLAFTNQIWNYDGDLQYNGIAAIMFGRFRNFSGLNLRVDDKLAVYDDRLTRGGPTARRPRATTLSASYFTDQRNRYLSTWSVQRTTDDAGQTNTNYSVDFRLQVRPNLDLSLGPSYTTQHSLSQFVGAQPDDEAAATGGIAYLFSTLDYRELGVQARMNWTFTPVLSVQLFVQPLIAAGDYSDVRFLAAPRTFDFTPFSGTTPDFDFNVRSLRGNAVLRWEYRPGSTLYFVWQQSRAGSAPLGDFDFSRDVRALGNLRPENIFAVKATYWLSR